MEPRWRKSPVVYEINTWAWLSDLTRCYDRPITLGTVPDADLDALAAWGFDAVWLMGVWERSAASRRIAIDHPDLQAGFRSALPDFQPEDDVVGSPYAVRRYVVDARLGGPEGLAALRKRLAARNLKLILDFVPNHVAVDHPILRVEPDCMLRGTDQDLVDQPGVYFRGPGEHIFAHGRDPHFPAWADTAQINPFSPPLRNWAATTLHTVAGQCDGVRCDMAMLVTNRIVAQTWGDRAGQLPETDYWEVVIQAVRDQFPHFLFMAEVYWDMEWELLQLGFDYTYDKRLYDRLRSESVRSVLGHLYADLGYQGHMVRFIENHDEPRATQVFGIGRDLAAAVLIGTLPGATLLHEGQLTGAQVRLPVQLGRRQPEPENADLMAFYRLLVHELRAPVYHGGTWQLREPLPAWDLNASHRSLLVFTWRQDDERRLIVVNYAPISSQGRVPLPDFELAGRTWRLYDTLHQTEYERSGDEMISEGLYIDLAPWQAHVFRFS